MIRNRFLLCGMIGWCWEIFVTGLYNAFTDKKQKMMGHSSLLMFPIYGAAFLIIPVYKIFKNTSIFFRGTIYTCMIFIGEYLSGTFLKKRDMCPWDYSNAKFNIGGVIRPDYAPAWFILGLIYEKVLTSK